MPLIVTSDAAPGAAVMVGQKWTVRTVKGAAVGTGGLSNCMGIVIHSPARNIGCLAHVEAEAIPQPYGEVFDNFVHYMISKIAKYGGQDAVVGLQVALFGNNGGLRSEELTASITESLVGRGVALAEIIDQRSMVGAGANHPVGTGVRAVGLNMTGTIVYDPATGSVHAYNLGKIPAVARSARGVRAKKLQP